MARGNKPKYLPCIARLDLDNEREYSNHDIAKKIWALGFKQEGVALHSIQESLTRAGKAHGMVSRKEKHPGWLWKQLAREYFENWPEVEAGFPAVATADPESRKKGRKVPIWFDLVTAVAAGLLAAFISAQPVAAPTIPYSRAEIEKVWVSSTGRTRYACFYAMRQRKPPKWFNHKPY